MLLFLCIIIVFQYYSSDNVHSFKALLHSPRPMYVININPNLIRSNSYHHQYQLKHNRIIPLKRRLYASFATKNDNDLKLKADGLMCNNDSSIKSINDFTLSLNTSFYIFDDTYTILGQAKDNDKENGNKNNSINNIHCQVCGDSFPSRNRLFQHFYHSSCTNELLKLGLSKNHSAYLSPKYDERQSVLLKIGYTSRSVNNLLSIEEIFTNILHEINQDKGLHITRSSSHTYRKSIYLKQDIQVNAMGDVLIYSEPTSIHHNKTISMWLSEVNQALGNSYGYLNMTVLSKSIIPKNVKLHAEQHCTSRVYTYLLPTSILIKPPTPARTIDNNVVPKNVISGQNIGSNYPTVLLGTESEPPSEQESGIYVMNRRVKGILKEIIGPKLTEKGGYKWRKSIEQQELRSLRRWHNYYRPYHQEETSNGWSPIVPSTDRVALRTLDRLYAEGVINIPIIPDADNHGMITPRESNMMNPTPGPFTTTSTGIINHSMKFLPLKLVGDSFLTGQVRTIVGLLICVYHGWLPQEFIAYSQRVDVIIEVPVIPPQFNLMLFSEARFDWHSAMPIHYSTEGGDDGVFQNKLYQEIANEAYEMEILGQYNHWLIELRDVICPRILQQYTQHQQQHSFNTIDDNLDNNITEANAMLIQLSLNNPEDNQMNISSHVNPSSNPSSNLNQVPAIYHRVLHLLRSADSSGIWPTTTKARQRVIKNNGLSLLSDNLTDNTQEFNETEKVGSFSVGRPIQMKNTPRGNKLFEELVEAVFELETLIIDHNLLSPSSPSLPSSSSSSIMIELTLNDASSNNSISSNSSTKHSIVNDVTIHNKDNKMKRAGSRMAAINRRAQFLPHKDAGAGFGQSLSMIVGLGDYSGGELSVEGKAYDIRYRPLEFDGWKQMHWTLPFEGERFSIIWFTPAEAEF